MFETWEELEKSISNCTNCHLYTNRTTIVLGIGNKEADLMFIGEAPGAEEDMQGIPFVGKAGVLLDKVFEGVGLNKEEFYFTNIVKCRPPSDRIPQKDETHSCLHYLRNQVLLVKPKIIVLLGNPALKSILGEEYQIQSSHGNWIENKGILYFSTWHPADLLRDEDKKFEFWKDLKEIRTKYINL